ncbi:MAG: trans-aconitate 2-methyltransferase [Planctomycetota bacterium]
MAPKLYRELAEWWPLVSPPVDYEDEARRYAELLGAPAGADVLELGSGGGHCAVHLARRYRMTLSDLSEDMLAQSRRLHPGAVHVQGDMRTLRLGREFAAVFVHDAIGYMTTADDLRAALATAAAHLLPGGRVLVVPDATRETFAPGTSTGGVDDGARGLRFLEWTHDPDPRDTRYRVDYAVLLRDGADVRCVDDHHDLGLFAIPEWLDALRAAGLEAETCELPLDGGAHRVFVGRRARG